MTFSRLASILILLRRFGRISPRQTFLWAVGLNFLNEIWLHLTGQKITIEPKKHIVKKSRSKALQRCAVHILPCALSLILVTLHLRHFYMGKTLNVNEGMSSVAMALLQVAAKTQELLIIASLATVIMHQLLSDLTNGPGVPFGFVGANFFFNQVQFFWSTSFYGAVKSLRSPLGNSKLLALVFVSGLLAAVAGPAVAVLLIPREHTWNAGGSMSYLAGNADDFWPSSVSMEHYMPEFQSDPHKMNCTSPYAYTNSLCPTGGYEALMQYFATGANNPVQMAGAKDSLYDNEDQLPTGLGHLIDFPQQQQDNQMPPYFQISSRRGTASLDTVAISVNGPAAWLARVISSYWSKAAYTAPYDIRVQKTRYKYFATKMGFVNASVPAVRAACSLPKPVNRSANVVSFPWVPDFRSVAMDAGGIGDYWLRNEWSTEIEWLPHQPATEYPKVSYVRLAAPEWTNATTGIIVEHPWINNQSRYMSGCVVDARWAPGAVVFTQNTPTRPVLHKDNIRKGKHIDLFRPTPQSGWTHINITHEVVNAINFELPDTIRPPIWNFPDQAKPTKVNALEAILYAVTFTDGQAPAFYSLTVEHALASVFADALARIGAWRLPAPVDGIPIPSPLVPDWENQMLKGDYGGWSFEKPPPELLGNVTYFQFKQLITGYAYKASEVTDYLAIAVVLLHLFIAITHTIVLVFWRKQSSGCWDTLPELLALVLQSTPSEHVLTNTATGIYKLKTFGETTRVLVSEEDDEHIELSFDADHGAGVLKKPDLDQKYG